MHLSPETSENWISSDITPVFCAFWGICCMRQPVTFWGRQTNCCCMDLISDWIIRYFWGHISWHVLACWHLSSRQPNRFDKGCRKHPTYSVSRPPMFLSHVLSLYTLVVYYMVYGIFFTVCFGPTPHITHNNVNAVNTDSWIRKSVLTGRGGLGVGSKILVYQGWWLEFWMVVVPEARHESCWNSVSAHQGLTSACAEAAAVLILASMIQRHCSHH